jgi:hypothetical protein
MRMLPGESEVFQIDPAQFVASEGSTIESQMPRVLRVPTLSIEYEACGRRGFYNVSRLFEKYRAIKLPDLRHVLANCPRAQSQSIHDGCRVRYGEDSRL